MTFLPEPGQRLLLVGKTGSGKTSGAIFVIKRLEAAPALIYDTKIEPKFMSLRNAIAVSRPHEVREAVEAGEHDYIVVRPPVEWMDDPATLDSEYLLRHYNEFQGLPAYIDEALTFHRNSQSGPGLTALLTRGRSKAITTVVSSQRPSRISRFCITEMDKAMIYRLQDIQDRKRLDDLITDFSGLKNPPRFHFYGWDANADDDENGENPPVLFSPVPLEAIANQGYVDSNANAVPDAVEAGGANENRSRRSIWV